MWPELKVDISIFLVLLHFLFFFFTPKEANSIYSHSCFLRIPSHVRVYKHDAVDDLVKATPSLPDILVLFRLNCKDELQKPLNIPTATPAHTTIPTKREITGHIVLGGRRKAAQIPVKFCFPREVTGPRTAPAASVIFQTAVQGLTHYILFWENLKYLRPVGFQFYQSCDYYTRNPNVLHDKLILYLNIVF